MTAKEYKELLNLMMTNIRELERKKTKEYASDKNQFYNLIAGGNARQQSPIDYLMGLKTKAYISLDVYAKNASAAWDPNGPFYVERPTLETVWEKIRDSTSYDFLYFALWAEMHHYTKEQILFALNEVELSESVSK